MTQDHITPAERALWTRYRQAKPAAVNQNAPDELTLAAYLEGRLDESDGQAVEAWLAADAQGLERFLAIRGALSDDEGPAPESLVRRAAALVPDPGAQRRPGGLGFRLWQSLAWSGGFAAVVLVCGLAFQLGQTTYANTLEVERYISQEASLGLDVGSGDLI